MRFFQLIALIVVTISLSACVRTVTPEGYVTEAGIEKYMRTLPTGYKGQRVAVLHPPKYQAPRETTSVVAVYEPEPAVVSAPPLIYETAPPAMTPPPQAAVRAPMPAFESAPVAAGPARISYPPAPWSPGGGVMPDASRSAATGASPVWQDRSSYADIPPVVAPFDDGLGETVIVGRPDLAAPAPVPTRQVDYGDHLTIVPLDGADAAMPYIPPATRSPKPLYMSQPYGAPYPSTSRSRQRAEEMRLNP